MLDWREEYKSICNAPLVGIKPDTLDDDHPAIKFAEYWHSLAGSGVPQRQTFRPQEIPSLLRWLMMFRREEHQGQDRYLLYLQGDSAAELTDGLQQGRYLDEFTEEECFDTRREVLRGVLRTGQPDFANIIVGTKKAEFIADINVGAFPFENADGPSEVVMVPAPASLELRRYL